MKDILDLELELNRSGWSLETQREILEHLQGKPKRFASPSSQEIYEESRRPRE